MSIPTSVFCVGELLHSSVQHAGEISVGLPRSASVVAQLPPDMAAEIRVRCSSDSKIFPAAVPEEEWFWWMYEMARVCPELAVKQKPFFDATA